jgi:formylglycine-generating enzyme required for sulfatase activity
MGRARKALPEGWAPINNSLGMYLALIPAGEFLMGAPDSDKDARDDEKPQHRVQISQPFFLGICPVTQAAYRAVTGTDPSYFRGPDDLPVEQVSWDAAIAFCNTLSEREGMDPYYPTGAGSEPQSSSSSGREGYRLPTEVEWEYAARAGSTTRYGFGNRAAKLGEYAWFDGNSQRETHPVCQKQPNAFGLFDMQGNVWEWCWDGYDAAYYTHSPAVDPAGPSEASHRVCRGGSWLYSPQLLRLTTRAWHTPGFRDYNIGFRLARFQPGR